MLCFAFNEDCLETFNVLKTRLVSAPVITAPDWGQEFELMCDASDNVGVDGAVSGRFRAGGEREQRFQAGG